MPLIVLSANTQSSLLVSLPPGMQSDGSFHLTHHFESPPPPETEFFIRQVSFVSRGNGRQPSLQSRSENKKPTMWLSIDIPQMEDIITAYEEDYIVSRYINAADNNQPFAFNKGRLRFPITCFPVDGFNGSDDVDTNTRGRESNKSSVARNVERGIHITNIPLGRMRLKENNLTVKITPREDLDRGLVSANDQIAERFPGIINLQVILEYK